MTASNLTRPARLAFEHDAASSLTFINIAPLLLLTVILCSVSNTVHPKVQFVCTAVEACVGPNYPINEEFPAIIGHHDGDQHWLVPFGCDI